MDVKDGEVFKVLKKIGEKGCALCLALGLLCIGLPEPIELNPLNCVRLSSVSVRSPVRFVRKSNSLKVWCSILNPRIEFD